MAFTVASDVYKAAIAGIEEEITHLKAKNVAIIQEATDSINKVTSLEAKKKAADEAGQEDKVKQLQK
jgi:hypothetical protein